MSAKDNSLVRVGSRKSELALIQTRYVISLLKQLYPEKEFEIVTMTTLGDRVLNISLPKIGEKSLFTKDLEDALRNGSVDLVVHSLKDLPTCLPDNMAIGAVLEREDPRDALVLREDFKGHTLATLPPGSIIGTSSLRRTAQISRSHPHLRVVDIRGNLNTRLKKLDYHCQSSIQIQENSVVSMETPSISTSNGTTPLLNTTNSESKQTDFESTDSNAKLPESSNTSSDSNGKEVKDPQHPNYAALILAQAGLVRMGWQQRISQVLLSKEVLYAVGQGALAIECRANNLEVLKMLGPLNHEDTYCRILAERSFLKTLGGGCSAPVAVSTTFKEAENSSASDPKKKLKIKGAVWSLNGKTKIQESRVHVFDTRKMSCKSSCPFDSKSKGGKHKLSETVTDIEQPDTKMFKTAAEVLCRRKMNQGESSNDGKKIINCCRMKTMNSTMEKAEPIEIENLINIHGKLFMSCPFSEGENGVCPVEFPIGQEVMGECPYLSDADKGLSETLVKMHPRRPSYDIKKCPFMSNQVVAINVQMEMNSLTENIAIPEYDLQKEPKAKNCPFLKQKNMSTMETLTENTLNTISETNSTLAPGESLETEDTEKKIKLFCGLTKHFNLTEEVLSKCEELGSQLANQLISHGALEVMKCAQDFIHSSIPGVRSIIVGAESSDNKINC